MFKGKIARTPFLDGCLVYNGTRFIMLLRKLYNSLFGRRDSAQQANDFLASALDLHKKGELDQAEALYLEALNRDPRNADVLHYLGVLNAQKGQIASTIEAIRYLRKALAIAPQHFAALNTLGTVLMEQRSFETALSQFDHALRLQPDAAQLWNSRGDALIALDRYGEACESYRRALDISPEFVEGHVKLGNALKFLGQLEAAIASYRKALEVNPDLAEVHYVLGNTLRLVGQQEQAMDSYRRVLAIQPNFTEVHYNLGNASGTTN